VACLEPLVGSLVMGSHGGARPELRPHWCPPTLAAMRPRWLLVSPRSTLARALAIVALAVAVGSCSSRAHEGKQAGASGFAATLERHLRAVEGRDLATLMGTVSDRDFMLILANGKVVGSRGEFEAMHRGWFSEQDWTIKFHVEKTVETAELAYAVATYDYEERLKGGLQTRKRRYLQLVFRKYDDGWKLVHDQNTPLDQAG
jgi:ketosteroid isomerase-like protein